MSRLILMSLIILNINTVYSYKSFKVAFEQGTLRFPSPLAFFSELEHIVPYSVSSDEECKKMNDQNVAILGANDPGTSAPLELNPGFLYFNFQKKCFEKIIKQSLSDKILSDKNSRVILGEELSQDIPQNQWSQIKINELPETLQIKISERMILYLVGPADVLKNYEYLGENNIFKQPNLNNISDLARFLLIQIKAIYPDLSLDELYIHVALLTLQSQAAKA